MNVHTVMFSFLSEVVLHLGRNGLSVQPGRVSVGLQKLKDELVAWRNHKRWQLFTIVLRGLISLSSFSSNDSSSLFGRLFVLFIS